MDVDAHKVVDLEGTQLPQLHRRAEGRRGGFARGVGCTRLLRKRCARGREGGVEGVQAVRDYLSYVRDEARKRYDSGLDAFDAAMDISMTDYDSWGDGERIVVNVATLYREFSADPNPPNVIELFGMMATVHKNRRR